jgi:hypothetical protein
MLEYGCKPRKVMPYSKARNDRNFHISEFSQQIFALDIYIYENYATIIIILGIIRIVLQGKLHK